MTKKYGPINPKFIPCANETGAPVEEVARKILEVFPGSAGVAKLKERIEAILRQHGHGAQGKNSCGTADNAPTSTRKAIHPIVETAERFEAHHLPNEEWKSLSQESREKINKWFNLAEKYLQAILNDGAQGQGVGLLVRAQKLLAKAKGYVDGYGVGSDSRLLTEAHYIIRELEAESVPSPESATKWNPIATAPRNASEMRVKMRDGTIHEKAHWAEDLSGSDQPPFKGWFVPDRHSGFTGIDEPEFWQPFFSPQSATNEL